MTDAEWAELIKWLQSKSVRLVIPVKGKPYLRDSAGRFIREF
jgi:hypothetical protein